MESVCCKVCSVDKDMLELEKIKPGKHEAMCNPRMQAQLLNSAGTELNFIVAYALGMTCSLPCQQSAGIVPDYQRPRACQQPGRGGVQPLLAAQAWNFRGRNGVNKIINVRAWH